MSHCTYRRKGHWFTTGMLTLAVLAPAGCRQRTDRLAVSGEVLLDGTLLDSGSIRFTSLGEGKLAASGAMIQDGAYNIPQEKGLPPGTYHVEIYSPDRAAPPVMARGTPGGPGIPVAPERIPEQYNINSKQTIEVATNRENHFVFDIASKPTE